MDNVNPDDAYRMNRQVFAAVKRKFRTRFACVVVADVALLVVAMLIALSGHTILGAFVIFALAPRVIGGPFVLFWPGNTLKLYTNVRYHRTSTLRRSALLSFATPMFIWMWSSLVAAVFLFFVAMISGFLALALAFADGFAHGLLAVLIVVFIVALGVYLIWSERAAYNWCVVDSVDTVLSDKSTRRSFVISSSILTHQAIERRFAAKTASINEKRRELRASSKTAGN